MTSKPTDSAPPQPAAAQPTSVIAKSTTSFGIVWILGIGFVVLLASAAGIYKLYEFADPANSDTAPLPRIVFNAPFITTPESVVSKMVEVANITDKDLVYDLGCGDGRLVIGAAVSRGCRGIGIDIEPKLVEEATKNAQQQGVAGQIAFEQKDVFKVDLSDANVIMMYLLPWMLEKLIPQLDRCKPGTRIVTHDFGIEGVKPDQTTVFSTEDSSEHRVHLYVTPLRHSRQKSK